MKITTISKVASLVISSVMIQTAVAGHAVGIGVGPHFGGGGFGGGIFEMFFGGGDFHSAPAFGGGARFSFGARPTFGQPAIVRSPSRNVNFSGQHNEQTHNANNQTDRGNTSRGHSCSARRVQHRSTSARRCRTLRLSQKTSIFRQGSKCGQRCAGRLAQSRGRDHSRLDRYDAGAAFYPLPSLERRS